MKNLFEVEFRTGDAKALVESDVAPPVSADTKELVECMHDGYSEYREQSFEDKLRQAVSLIRGAIMDEAHKNLGDDGKVPKKYDPDNNPWATTEKMLAKAVFVDQFKPLVARVRAEINKFYE